MQGLEYLELAERHYFHEFDRKEKLLGRLQFSLALIAAEFSVLGYMARTLDLSTSIIYLIIFGLFLLATACVALIAAITTFRAFGHTYKGNPTLKTLEEYKAKVIEHNEKLAQYNKDNFRNKQPPSDPDQKHTEALTNYYVECSSENALISDTRAVLISDAMKALRSSCIPLAFACVMFVLLDLDAGSPRKDQTIANATLNNAIDRLNPL